MVRYLYPTWALNTIATPPLKTNMHPCLQRADGLGSIRPCGCLIANMHSAWPALSLPGQSASFCSRKVSRLTRCHLEIVELKREVARTGTLQPCSWARQISQSIVSPIPPRNLERISNGLAADCRRLASRITRFQLIPPSTSSSTSSPVIAGCMRRKITRLDRVPSTHRITGLTLRPRTALGHARTWPPPRTLPIVRGRNWGLILLWHRQPPCYTPRCGLYIRHYLDAT